MPQYVDLLEEVMMHTARDFDVSAVRSPINPGIYAGDRKLGSVGIAIRHEHRISRVCIEQQPVTGAVSVDCPMRSEEHRNDFSGEGNNFFSIHGCGPYIGTASFLAFIRDKSGTD